MRAVNIERVKRRVLQEAVAENVDVIQGLPPRGVRPVNRIGRVWMKRMPFLLVPLTLFGATYLSSRDGGGQALLPVHRATMVRWHA